MKAKLPQAVLTLLGCILASSASATEAVKSASSRPLLLIVAGQSNAVGWNLRSSDLPPKNRTSDAKTWIWQPAKFAPADGFQILGNGVNNDWNRDANHLPGQTSGEFWGPEVEFSYRFRQAFPQRPLYIVKRPVGGTQLALDPKADDWSPQSPSNELYGQLMQFVRDARSSLSKHSVNDYEIVLMWVQGESDSLYLANAQHYGENLQNLFNSIRQQLSEPNTRILFNHLNVVPRWIYAKDIRRGEEEAQAHITNSILVATPDLPLQSDGAHFTSTGQIELGLRMFNAYTHP